MLKARATAAGFTDGEFSPHSLRSGFITTAYKGGKDRYRIKQVSGHKSDAVLDMYIRAADRFTDSAGRLA
jgi:integrase